MSDKTNALNHLGEASRLLWVIDQEWLQNPDRPRTLTDLALVALGHAFLALALDALE